MVMDFDSVPEGHRLLLPVELSDMKYLLDSMEHASQDLTSNQQNRPHINVLRNYLQILKRYTQPTNSEKTSPTASKTTSSLPNENTTTSRYSILREVLLSESMTVSLCHSLSISSLDTKGDLRRGIINLFGTFSTPTSRIYLHSFRCITLASQCWVIHTRPSDITKYDIVLPKKSRPTLNHELIAQHLGLAPNAYLLQWKNILK